MTDLVKVVVRIIGLWIVLVGIAFYAREVWRAVRKSRGRND